jgi:hypothetical protein
MFIVGRDYGKWAKKWVMNVSSVLRMSPLHFATFFQEQADE